MAKKAFLAIVLLFFLALLTPSAVAGTPSIEWTDFQFRFDENAGAIAAEETDITVTGNKTVILATNMVNSGGRGSTNMEYILEWRVGDTWNQTVVKGGTTTDQNVNARAINATPVSIWVTTYNLVGEDSDGFPTGDYFNLVDIDIDDAPETAEVWWAINANEQAGTTTYDLRIVYAADTADDTYESTIENYTVAMASITVEPVPAAEATDTNVWQVRTENDPDTNYVLNKPLPFFHYDVNGDLFIDFNVFNNFNNRLTVDIEYSTERTKGSGTAIETDLNLDATYCSDQDWNDRPSLCTYQWDTSTVPDGNYYIVIDVDSGTDNDVNDSANDLHVGPTAPVADVNVWQISTENAPDTNYVLNEPMPSFTFASDGDLNIDFNVFNNLNHRMIVDIRYSTTRTQGSGTLIANDENLDGDFCGDLDWDDSPSLCFFSWDISGVTDDNYFILIEVYDSTYSAARDFNDSANDFHVNPTEDSCSCPSSGHWEIKNGDICTLDDLCDVPSGSDLHIIDGSLNVTSTGTLTVSGGGAIIIQEANGADFFVESGGKVVIRE